MPSRIPIILTGQALRSLRDSGYSISAAIAEVVDNSLEAQANCVKIRLDENAIGKGKKHIHRIAVSDDGAGMDSYVLHHYPQIGYSTRYMSTTTIGKYGVGAKLAALNYSERLDVWSRTALDQPWMHVYFDLEEAEAVAREGGTDGIERPSELPVPSELVNLLPEGSGTLVVWSKIDRLEEGRHSQDANSLRVEIEKELSRIFRYFLEGGIQIDVNDTKTVAARPTVSDGRHMGRPRAQEALPTKRRAACVRYQRPLWAKQVSRGRENQFSRESVAAASDRLPPRGSPQERYGWR